MLELALLTRPGLKDRRDTETCVVESAMASTSSSFLSPGAATEAPPPTPDPEASPATRNVSVKYPFSNAQKWPCLIAFKTVVYLFYRNIRRNKLIQIQKHILFLSKRVNAIIPAAVPDVSLRVDASLVSECLSSLRASS